jgi:hypothetical protein
MAGIEQPPSISSIAPTVGTGLSLHPDLVRPICATCLHWNELDPDGGSSVFVDGNYEVTEGGTGQCRRYPPTTRRTDWRPEIPGGTLMDSMDAAGSAYWPVTYDEDWCGEHARPSIQFAVAS